MASLAIEYWTNSRRICQHTVGVCVSGGKSMAHRGVGPHIERRAVVDRRARPVAVYDDITKMPMGYQTLVGDMGSSLSGGQKQRVLLARALYKSPRVLALDEATSHLDIANERRVTEALATMPLTRIIVAHRPETIAGAERVVGLDRGRALELRQPEAPVAIGQPA